MPHSSNQFVSEFRVVERKRLLKQDPTRPERLYHVLKEGEGNSNKDRANRPINKKADQRDLPVEIGLRLPQPTLMLGGAGFAVGNISLPPLTQSSVLAHGGLRLLRDVTFCHHTKRLVALRLSLSMSTEEDCLDSDARQLEYARTLALPQALSLDLSLVAMLVLGNDPLIPLCGGGEDSVQQLTSSVAQRLLVDLCNIKVVLALPLQSVHGTENAADAFQAWLEWSISQEMNIG